MTIPTVDTCDVWEPAENVQTGGSVRTATYSKSQEEVACNFHHVTAQARLMAGLDLTMEARKLFLYGTTTKPGNRCVVWNLGDGTAWQLAGPATYHKTPVSDGHWEILLTELQTPHKEILEAYG